jgi:hypothetical protein
MSIRTHVRESWTRQLGVRPVLLSLLFAVVAGCAPAGTQPVNLPTPTLPSIPSPTIPLEVTLPSDWETYTNPGQCGFAINHRSDMDITSQGMYSWNLSPTATTEPGLVPNFVYISVIPDDFQSSESGVIYNYDPAETQTLLNMPVGESKSLRDDPNLAPSFTYTRLPDVTLGNQAAQAYENTQPWEFPSGTKEIRYYLKANSCTYLVGGYVDTVGSGQPGSINEDLFDEIIAAFQVNP